MKSHRVKKEERRHGPDKTTKYTNFLSLAGWILAFVAVVIIYAAKPDYYWDRTQQTANPNSWDLALAQWSCVVMSISFATSLVGLFINHQRLQRKGDTYSFNLIALAILSALSILGYLINF